MLKETLGLTGPLALAMLSPAALGAQPLPPLELEPVVSGLPAPVAIAHAGDARLFVVSKGGSIVIVDGGEVLPEPFLDLTPLVGSDGFEQGLLGLAFHPDYDVNGFFYVNYTNLADDTVIARYERSAGDPNRADPTSATVLLTYRQPRKVHNGGQLAFGPDGLLYVGSGDGGGRDDPFCNAQKDGTLLGKILRLDVDAPEPAPEIYAKGLRNPWRFSFDRATGDLYVADVGQESREEVTFLPAGTPAGSNLGWPAVEGTVCRGANGCENSPACDDPTLVAPFTDYPHVNDDCSVTGGYVYRGALLPELAGVYVFGDFCSGRLRASVPTGMGTFATEILPLAVPTLTSFGEDVSGELYLTTITGELFRLAPGTATGPCVPGDRTLCLNGGRFRVEAFFRTPQGDSGKAHAAAPLTDDTGYFWFFDEDNVEVVVKVLDACIPEFDRFWVFASGLTNVEVQLVVTDTREQETQRYLNPLGQAFQPIQDTGAFATCP